MDNKTNTPVTTYETSDQLESEIKQVTTSKDFFAILEKLKQKGKGFISLSLHLKNKGATHNELLDICFNRNHITVKASSGRTIIINRGNDNAYWYDADQSPDEVPEMQTINHDKEEINSLIHVTKRFEELDHVFATTVSGRTIEMTSEGIFNFTSPREIPSIYFLYELIPTDLNDKGKIYIEEYDSPLEIISFELADRVEK